MHKKQKEPTRTRKNRKTSVSNTGSDNAKPKKPRRPMPLPRGWEKSISGSNLAKAFGVSSTRISHLNEEGMPRNEDGSYNLPECWNWRINRTREAGTDDPLKQQKLQAEVDLKQAKLKEINNQFIDREEHERIMCARARAFRDFWPQLVRKNSHLLVGQNNIEAVNELLMAMAEQGMKAWTGASE